jgi:transposase
MDRYIGLDVHAQSTAVAIVSPTGKRLSSKVVETSATALIDVLKEISGTKRVVLEEGTQSTWLSQVLSPHVHELVVMCPEKSRARAKNDIEDAFARAEDLRRNAIDRRIFKPALSAMSLRDALALYSNFTRDSVRAKNRFKALLRSRGVTGLGADAYDPEPEALQALLEEVPESVALNAEATLEQILMLENLRDRARDVLIGEAKKQTAFRYLFSVPGLGAIRAATVLAVVVTPERFRRSHQFWSYCGLGIRTESSSDYSRGARGKWTRRREPMTRGLKHGNSMLKNVFRGAADTIVRSLPEHPLHRHYRRLTEKMKDNLARLTLARKLAAITLAVWKKQEEYDPTKHMTFE